MNKPLLSIVSITYNHEKFIAQAIDSWLMQKTDFDIEIVIGEDCSIDNTLQIIKEYQKRHPHLIKIITSDTNVGMQANFIRTLQACNGKYIAICEGDDYWTDPLKLQKQVDFLENNNEYSFSCHNFKELYEETQEIKNPVHTFLPHNSHERSGTTFSLDNFMWPQPLTMVFRKEIIEKIPFEKYKFFRDVHLIYHLYKYGKLFYFHFYGGVYRKHKGGMASIIPWDKETYYIYNITKEILMQFPRDEKKRFYEVAYYYLIKKIKFQYKNNPFRWKDIRMFSIKNFTIYVIKTKIIMKVKKILKKIIGQKFINKINIFFRSNDLNKLAQIFNTDKYGKHNYTPIYMQYFRSIRKKKLNILEIGVGGYDDPNKGGASLKMWKYYFKNSQICAIDIYDKAKLQEKRIKIFQGSQVDTSFLEDVTKQIGGLDIIIDDGSHINEHIILSFEFLFSKLKSKGIYVIEDTQTSYWNEYGGDCRNLSNPNTTMNYFKSLVDAVNYLEFDNQLFQNKEIIDKIDSIHFYHNLIFILKK